MELVLPKNYVEVSEEEMMYLDGGRSWSDAEAVALAGLGYIIGNIVGRGVSQSLVGAAMRAAGGWVATQINAIIYSAFINPAFGVALAIGGLAVVGTTVFLIGRNRKWW